MKGYFWQENPIPRLLCVHTIIAPHILLELCTETKEKNMKRDTSKFEP